MIRSRTTDTTIKIPVPPTATAVLPVVDKRIIGRTAISPKNDAPKNVNRDATFAKYSSVEAPGRIQGTKAPDLCKFSLIASGSKVIAV